jgi:hypothetical protein
MIEESFAAASTADYAGRSVWITVLDAGGLTSFAGEVELVAGSNASISLRPGQGTIARGEEVLVTYSGIQPEQRLGRITDAQHNLLQIAFLERG